MLRFVLFMAAIVAVILTTGCPGLDDIRKVHPRIEVVALDPNSSTIKIVVNRKDATLEKFFFYGFDDHGGQRYFDWKYSPGGVVSNKYQTTFTLIIMGASNTAIEYGATYHAVIGVSAPVFDYSGDSDNNGATEPGYAGGEYTLITPPAPTRGARPGDLVVKEALTMSQAEISAKTLELGSTFKAQFPNWERPVPPVAIQQ